MSAPVGSAVPRHLLYNSSRDRHSLNRDPDIMVVGPVVHGRGKEERRKECTELDMECF